jgi:hypothetical protein
LFGLQTFLEILRPSDRGCKKLQVNVEPSRWCECDPDATNRLNQIAPNQFSIKPQHPIPQPLKHPVSPRISRNPLRMVTPVNFHN